MIASDLLIPDSERRLAAVLRRFGGLQGLTNVGDDPVAAGTTVHVPVTQAELAAAANLSRNSAGTILKRFATRGIIDTGYRDILITDPARLIAVVKAGGAG
jgi:CRP-like cAMP-binding protein